MLDPDSDQTGMKDDDLHFLLYFILGMYFGPDIKGEQPRKSILQRISEGFPPYTSDELVGSHMKLVEIEQVLRFVIRKADRFASALSPLLCQFFQGKLPILGEDPSASYPQFPDLFPPALHPHSEFSDGNTIVENIAFINDPEVYYVDLDDAERFTRLTGLEDFLLDEEAVRLHTPSDVRLSDSGVSHNAGVDLNGHGGGLSHHPSSGKSKKTRCMDEIMEQDDQVMSHISSNPDERAGPAMVVLPSFPTKSELSNIVAASKRGFALTGSAVEGKLGPTIGLMDIGECSDSYLFRISLPGVKRDARDFSCEVESGGKVVIRGVTPAGEKTVYRYSHMFEMQTQNLCPPGRFSVSFKLPGPVDPQQFSGNFGTDGILEGIVMKDRDIVGR